MQPFVGYDYLDKFTRRRTSERIRQEWIRADWDCVLFLTLLCKQSSPDTTSEASGVREGGFPSLGRPSTDFVRDSLEATISMHGRRRGNR
jgi:hypothetical protein